MGTYNKYPPEVHEFVKEHTKYMRDQDLAEACNEALGTHFTKSTMKAFRGNYGYRNYQGKWTSEEYWKYQTRYPQGMFEFIRDNSWGVSSKDMAEMVNEKFGTDFTPNRMKEFRARYKIKSGETGWYQKGHVPGNKGKKLEEFITDPERLAEIRAKMEPTMFKKGERSRNYLPVGTVTTTTDGYVIRKISDEGTQWERWEYVHRRTWEDANGPVPDGMMIIFRDGNRQNCDLSNLMLISKSDNASLNKLGLRSTDPDLLDVGINLVHLKRAAKVAKKRKKNEG